MTFFHDLNKRLAQLAAKTEQQQIAESATAPASKTKLAESIEVAEAGPEPAPAREIGLQAPAPLAAGKVIG